MKFRLRQQQTRHRNELQSSRNREEELEKKKNLKEEENERRRGVGGGGGGGGNENEQMKMSRGRQVDGCDFPMHFISRRRVTDAPADGVAGRRRRRRRLRLRRPAALNPFGRGHSITDGFIPAAPNGFDCLPPHRPRSRPPSIGFHWVPTGSTGFVFFGQFLRYPYQVSVRLLLLLLLFLSFDVFGSIV